MYSISETFKNIEWTKHVEAERGAHEYYEAFIQEPSTFDDRVFTVRITVMIDSKDGKPFSVLAVLGDTNKNYYLTPSESIGHENFAGKYCEELAINFIKKTFNAWNMLLKTNFNIKGIN